MTMRSPINEVMPMRKVMIKINYKSGQVELAKINLIKYGQVLVGLMSKGLVEKTQIISQ
jgi:hypothetical protein